ncbi:MAG: site-specific DNA-methyltransferase, partial [Chloroflexi bacterium]|nr:site-specific DNA-methyltransferase [Chloroflexota bacterium]
MPLELETRGIEFETNQLETRNEYRERLREHLRDPDFRAIEGFPIGDDEAILALSDPPYYTACPNPFLPEIIERWQTERAQIREELDLPDDSADNGDSPSPDGWERGPGGEGVYHREPFASDVSEGKNDPIYNAHSYHTKVPHKAVMRYILHYTDPGDIVFDGFCGTGMTGVAAQLCGDRKAVEELGYRVDDDGTIYTSPLSQSLGEGGRGGEGFSRLGARKAVLVDLCPAATFIAYNYNTPVDVAAFEREAKRILREVEEECGWMYETWHPHCDHPQRVKGRINYTVWSDVFVCPQCGEEMVFWDVAVDKGAGRVHSDFPCSGCGAEQTKRTLERAWETVYDRALSKTIRRAKHVPVLINYSVGNRRCEKRPDTDDLALIHRIEESDIPYWFPTDPMMFKGEQWGDTWRAGVHAGITHVHHFYTQRNLWVLAAFANRTQTPPVRLKGIATLWLTSSLIRTTKLYKFTLDRKMGNVSGTLYIPSIWTENSPMKLLRGKARVITQSMTRVRISQAISTGSSTEIPWMDTSSVDYIFTDPPFGGNLMYSELNFLWEAWLQVFTNNGPEAVVNKIQRKGLSEYQRLMEQCFSEFYRALKPGRWMTVEFHNSQNRVWNAIQEAILRAGFMIADVRTLDKQQGTFKQVTTTGAVKQDLIISAYKPRVSFERRFHAQAGTPEGAWDFVRQHLAQLPVVVERDGSLEVVAERQAYLLFDRMVAFHIQRGATVPLSAAEFYAGLRERFPERDGMFFLPDQVPEYDRARLQATEVAQLTLFVSDEKSSIQWLRQQLDSSTGGYPQTYQEIQPQFLRQLHQARHEALPELSDILEQNFLQDEAGRWYVPDPNRASDLEKLRQRALLREFAQYVEGRGRLRQFRTEAVRAGFADAWRRHDYTTIVKVAE